MKKVIYFFAGILLFVLIPLILNLCGITNYSTEPPTIVMPTYPQRDIPFDLTDPPPVFTWQQEGKLARSFIMEFYYTDKEISEMLNSSTAEGCTFIISETAEGCTYFFMSKGDWEYIKETVPTVDHYKRVYWRVKVNDETLDEETCYFGWNFFEFRVESLEDN